MDKQKVNKILEELAGDILTSTGCALCWGEVEVPECMKNDVEESE